VTYSTVTRLDYCWSGVYASRPCIPFVGRKTGGLLGIDSLTPLPDASAHAPCVPASQVLMQAVTADGQLASQQSRRGKSLRRPLQGDFSDLSSRPGFPSSQPQDSAVQQQRALWGPALQGLAASAAAAASVIGEVQDEGYEDNTQLPPPPRTFVSQVTRACKAVVGPAVRATAHNLHCFRAAAAAAGVVPGQHVQQQGGGMGTGKEDAVARKPRKGG
jgi:hypothetical protein